MPYLTYTGKAQAVDVKGFGTFAHGESKQVDNLTAAAFSDDACYGEGWHVSDEIPEPEDRNTTDTDEEK